MMDDCMLPATGSGSAGIVAIAAVALLLGVGAMFIVRRRPAGAVVLLLVAGLVGVVGTTGETADAAPDCVPTTTSTTTTTAPPAVVPPTTTAPTTTAPTTTTTTSTTSTTTTTTTIALRAPIAVPDSFPVGTDSGNILSNDDLGNPTAVITSLNGSDITDPTLFVGQNACADWYFTTDIATGAVTVTQRGFGECLVPYTITNSQGSSSTFINLGGLEFPA